MYVMSFVFFFFFNDTATTDIYTYVHALSLHDALPICRTGSMFACEQAGITPDFLCLSKALTGGYLPMAAVLTTDQVYRAFYDDYSTLRAFLHSHPYTGNPLACAAALATLDIFPEEIGRASCRERVCQYV